MTAPFPAFRGPVPETRPIEGESWERWLHEIRRYEFERTMAHVPLAHSATVLELGSGDGYQLGLLSERFERVFAIDPERRPSQTSRFAFAVAETLPFPDHSFDLVISCCVTEHLVDRKRAMAEAVRVLRPGGYMAHIVPSPFWKATSLLLNPVGYPIRVWEKWRALRKIERAPEKSARESAARAERPRALQVLGRWFYPPVHGTYCSHYAEYKSYARERWLEMMVHPRLAPVAELPLVAYTQFGLLRFCSLPMRAWLARHGLASSRAFILRKTDVA